MSTDCSLNWTEPRRGGSHRPKAARVPLLLSLFAAACCLLNLGLARADGQEAKPDVAASAVGPDYIIGPGDTLDIFVWRNPELSTRVPVRPDGKISTPLVEDISAVGKTTSQLAREMEAVLGKFIRTPNVNVIVSQAVSAASQVVVVGQAANPRALPYRDGLRVLDIMIAVGGMTDFAAGNRAKIVRESNGKREEIRVKLKDLMEDGDLSQNQLLRPGDVLVIPESFF